MRWLITLLICGGLAAQAVTLPDLPGIARARAERQRAAQEKALEPYWADLSLQYSFNNKAFIDDRIETIVAFSDSVVPLLLEKLTPPDEREQSSYLAENCRRILERLDASSFLEELEKLAVGDSSVARSNAIVLLGHTGSKRAVQLLRELLPDLGTDADQRRAVEALTRLKATDMAEQVVALLDGADAGARRAILDYLNELKPAAVAGSVLASFESQRDASLLPRYIEYLSHVVKGDDSMATRLLALPFQSWPASSEIALLHALATIAPAKHGPTRERLRQILNQGQEGELGRAAAVTLHKLGDDDGMNILYRKLNADVRRSRDEATYGERGELHYALGMWPDAVADFRQAVRLTTRPSKRRLYQLRIARCESQRGRWNQTLAALKDSGARYLDIQLEAEQDDALRRALDEDIIRRWLEGLPRR